MLLIRTARKNKADLIKEMQIRLFYKRLRRFLSQYSELSLRVRPYTDRSRLELNFGKRHEPVFILISSLSASRRICLALFDTCVNPLQTNQDVYAP